MKIKNCITKFLLIAFMATSVSGCSNTTTESPAESVSVEEPSASQDISQPVPAATEASTQEDASNDLNSDYYMNKPFDNPEAGRAPAIPGNGKHFVKYDDKIYFRIPKEAAMREAALWGDYDFVMADDSSTIACIDVETDEITDLFDDSSYGPITISGGRLILQESKGGKETSVQSVSFDGSDRYDLPGTTVYGTLPSGEYFATGGYESDHKLHLYICDANGDSKEIQNSSDIISYAGIGGDYLFCVTKASDSPYGRFSGYDLKTAEEIIYGDLPEVSEDVWYPAEPEYLTVNNGTVMVQMSGYEGTGHFYSNSKHFYAQCDEPGSLEESIPVGSPVYLYDSARSPAVTAGGSNRFIYVEGEPGTCAVVDDYVGYFDENGSFVKVWSGYGNILYDNYEDRADTEICELVDGNIYVVRNQNEFAKEACIGWRDAYRRSATSIERISLTKKHVYPMLSLISDPLYNLVADDIYEKYRTSSPTVNSISVGDEAKEFGLWVQETIGKDNFPAEIREMGTNIGNRYEFCFGTDVDNNFDNNIPSMYKVYYSLKKYYSSDGKKNMSYYESLMDDNRALGNGDPETIESMYKDLQEFVTACNNILREQ